MIIKLAVLDAQTQSFLKKNIRLVRCESRITKGTLGRVIHFVDSNLIAKYWFNIKLSNMDSIEPKMDNYGVLPSRIVH